MRLVKTGQPNKIGVIAATRKELADLRHRSTIRIFDDAISLQPVKNEHYQCVVMVYTFEDIARAKLFRLAYSQAMKRTKHVRIRPVQPWKPSNWYKSQRKAAVKRRRAYRARKRAKTRYFKLIPILKAGNIATIEAKARQIARAAIVADLV